ncbi:MAG: DUF4234 domain-containing protein [Candidatus Bathyarchaeota archaeon]|nr:DUF4234 domain-containing protein [Candidatus Bathyarchaeum sp.]
MEPLLNNLRKDIRMQKESDRQMSTAWILVYIIPFIVSLVIAAYFTVTLLDVFSSIDFSDPQSYNYSYDWLPAEFVSVWLMTLLMGAANCVVTIFLNYLLVNRRATHFKRQKFLSEDIISTIDYLAKTKDISVDVNLSSLQRTLREANYEETEKSAILWSILSAFVPFIQLYVYYFLVKDFYRHEHREDGFWVDASGALNTLGVNFSVPQRIKPMPYRSFVLYLILSIVTAGMFAVYWLYVLVKDPNEHFKAHIQAETQLLTALESVTV